MKLPMKISSLLLILLSINLVACLGEEAPETTETTETTETPIYDGVIGSAIEDCDKSLASISVFEQVYRDFQQVHNNCIEWDGNNGKLVVKYRSSDANVTGLGLSIHYSSAQLNNIEINDVLGNDLITKNVTSERDKDNKDGDSSTDMVIDMAWASISTNWPGQKEVNLVTLEFTKESGAQIDYIMNYTSSSNATGYELILGK